MFSITFWEKKRMCIGIAAIIRQNKRANLQICSNRFTEHFRPLKEFYVCSFIQILYFTFVSYNARLW